MPRRMQALLAGHRWDWTLALAALQQFIVARPGDAEVIVIPGQGTAGSGAGTGQDEVRGQVGAGRRDDHRRSLRAGAVLLGGRRGDLRPHGTLRRACEKPGQGYVLAVPVNFAIRLPSGRTATASLVAAMAPGAAWETRSYRPGCKRPPEVFDLVCKSGGRR